MAVNDCLLNCLREVRLERFHANFTERGLTNCEQLSSLIVDDYGRFGIVSTDDRRRLFQLIQIIKSVQNDGVHCQHGAVNTAASQRDGVPLTTRPNVSDSQPAHRKHELPDVTKISVVPARKVAAGGDADTGKCPMAPTRQFIKPVPNNRNYRVQYDQSCDQPQMLVTRETKVATNKVPPSTEVSCGTPKFDCRKVLTFSDSDVYSEDGDSIGCDGTSAKPSLQSQISNSVTMSSPLVANRSCLRPSHVVSSSSVSSPRAFVIPAEHKPMMRHRSTGNRVYQMESQNDADRREFRDRQGSFRTPQYGRPMKKASSQNDNSRQHAYFPTAKVLTSEEPPTYIEQISHSSGYNYGVPGSTVQLSDKVILFTLLLTFVIYISICSCFLVHFMF